MTTQTLPDALRATRLYTDHVPYTLIKIPPLAFRTAWLGDLLATPFCALLMDKDEITLVVATAAWQSMLASIAPRPADPKDGTIDMRHLWKQSDIEYRLITFDVELTPTLTGYMARISAALAEADVPILPFAAFSRDHILVPASRFKPAWAALERLIAAPP